MSTTSPFRLDHLERPEMRDRMVGEWRKEIARLEARSPRQQWPFGADLSELGWVRFLESMPIALGERDMAWLADHMCDTSLWRPMRRQTSRKGKPYALRINITAVSTMLAFGEYNLAYTRAVAGSALDEGIATCEVYRAGPAAAPRWSCSCLEGPGVSCVAILEGLRAYHTGRFVELAVPAGPNCHHSIRIREWLEAGNSNTRDAAG